MPTLGLQLQPGTLDNPECWPSTPAALYAEMFSKGRALIGSLTGIILSPTAPAATDRDKGWVKTSGGHPIGIFAWDTVLNLWLWRHDYAPSSPVRLLFVGSAADLATFDGGEAGSPSVAAGPMWQIDTDFEGRFPIGPGTLNGNPVAVGGTGGAGQATLTEANMPPHTHTVPKPVASTAAGGNPGILYDSYSGTLQSSSTGGSGTPPVAQPFAIVPPYRGVYFIKRTIREYYRG